MKYFCTQAQQGIQAAHLPRPEQWLGSVTGAVSPVPPSPRRAPALHLRAHSLGSAAGSQAFATRGGPSDPFDAEWAEIAARNLQQSTTNPFIMPNATQAFQVQL